MALPQVRPFSEWVVCAATPTVGTSPQNAVCVAPVKGHVMRVGMASNGALTGTTTATVTTTASGATDIASGLLSIAAGTGIVSLVDISGINTANTSVSEGDTITFTPSGGTGASIGGNFWAVIREQG